LNKRNRKKSNIATIHRAGPTMLNNGLLYVPAQQQQGILGQTFYGSQTANVPTGQEALFSPGIPLQNQPGVNSGGYPVQWRFPVAVNTFPVDRTSNNPDIPSFQQLRQLAKMYNGITLCERAWLDMVPRMQFKIELKPEYITAGANEKDYQTEIAYFMGWFESPDKMHDLHSWLRMALREQTQIDELYIYKRKKRNGELYSLEIHSGDQFKPLLDDWGRIPQPPNYAYQQYPWGIPGAWFKSDELIHYQESPAADNPYGQSRVERILLLVNQALRKQKKDLSHFTEGNIPQGMMEVPESSTWTPDQIDAYEQQWNSLISGNASQQVKIKFTQPGMKYQKYDQYDLSPDFDKFIINIAVSVYGLSMQDLSFTENIHKSSGDSQQNVVYRRTIDPLAVIYSQILTGIINEDFPEELHGEMFRAVFTGYDEEEDVSELADAYTKLTNAGLLGISNASKLLKLPDDPNAPYIGRVVMTKDGPIFLDDIATEKVRQAQLQAKMATYQQQTEQSTTTPGQPGKTVGAVPGAIPKPPTAPGVPPIQAKTQGENNQSQSQQTQQNQQSPQNKESQPTTSTNASKTGSNSNANIQDSINRAVADDNQEDPKDDIEEVDENEETEAEFEDPEDPAEDDADVEAGEAGDEIDDEEEDQDEDDTDDEDDDETDNGNVDDIAAIEAEIQKYKQYDQFGNEIDYDALTEEDIAQEKEILKLLEQDLEHPYSPLERYVVNEFGEELDTLDRHGHHDQKVHGNWTHPAYGADHDKTPKLQKAMAAKVAKSPIPATKSSPASTSKALTNAQNKLTKDQAALKAAQAEKPATAKDAKKQTTLEKRLTKDIATDQQHIKTDTQKAQEKATADKVKAEVKAKAEKTKEEAAKEKEETKEKAAKAKAKAKAKADKAKAEAKKIADEKKKELAEAKAKAKAAAATAKARAKAQSQAAHLQKMSAAASAKTARMNATLQRKSQIAAVNAAKTNTAQSKSEMKTAQAAAAAAKAVQAISKTIGNKASLYNALSGRKISKTWTAKESQESQTISSDLKQVMDVINAHQDESNAVELLDNVSKSLNELQNQKGISSGRASSLEHLVTKLEQQISLQRVLENEIFDEISAYYRNDQRDTIRELLQILDEQTEKESTEETNSESVKQPKEIERASDKSDGRTENKFTNQTNASSEDYRRWRQRAIDDVKSGRPQRGFTTTLIPEMIHKEITIALSRSTTVDEVKSIFRLVQVSEIESQRNANG
jgi:hypothetical protein